MSEESSISGAIVAWAVHENHSHALDEFNASAIAKLPKEQERPEVTPAMFTVPRVGDPGIPRYRLQVIHFGASYNGLAWDWPTFLDKFESLLKTMAWTKAHLLLDADLLGDFQYQWQAKQPYDPNRLAGVSQWEFKGGPRTFEPYLKK
jgi:hypothetical protein